ncbi:MAG: hypothetical protein OXB96_01815 [Candidatus Kaiserbacteria bacterium]|nr:hypothetical protein [Candidatus Kaiserbacteria bacterium]
MVTYAQEVAETLATSGGSEGLFILSIIINIIALAFGSGRLFNEIKNTKSEVASMSGRLDKQGEKIDRVAEGLAEIRGSFLVFKEAVATQQSSPLTLTKRGEEILQKSGGDTILKNLFEDLYSRFEGVTNAYDIQRRARQVIEDLFDEGEKLELVKNYLYNEKENHKTVVDVLGIELRDMVFERRGMPIKKREKEPEPSVVRDEVQRV